MSSFISMCMIAKQQQQNKSERSDAVIHAVAVAATAA